MKFVHNRLVRGDGEMPDGWQWHMDEMDRVLDRLRDRAELHAEAGFPLSMADARRIVSLVCDGECESSPPSEVQEHLASELIRLAAEAANARRVTRQFGPTSAG
jgi:hypothetical protein